MATLPPIGTRVRVAFPAKADPESPLGSVFFGHETEGVVTGHYMGSADVRALDVEGDELDQFVDPAYLTAIESKES